MSKNRSVQKTAHACETGSPHKPESVFPATINPSSVLVLVQISLFHSTQCGLFPAQGGISSQILNALREPQRSRIRIHM